jgi:hypothetical protein
MNMENRTAEREVKRGGVTREQGEEEENCSSHRERPLKVPAQCTCHEAVQRKY